jgi:hypothetical protein
LPQYTQVIRNPRLFHQSNLGAATFIPTQFTHSSSTTYWPHLLPSSYFPQSQIPYNLNQPVVCPPSHAYLYSPAIPANPMSLPISFSYADSIVNDCSEVSSKGLTFILIAILILAALDLVIVRPQKKP